MKINCWQGNETGKKLTTEHKNGSYWRSSLLWVPLTICTLTLLIVDFIEIDTYSYDVLKQQLANYSEYQPLKMEAKTDIKEFTINQKGCRIPYLDAFDENIAEYIFKPKQLNCSGEETPPNIVHGGTNTIYIDANYYYRSLNETTGSVECCLREFWRVPPENDDRDIQFVRSDNCTMLKNNQINVFNNEFVLVECQIENKTHKYFYASVPKEKVGEKLKMHDTIKQKPYLNILIVGLDAVSRLNFHRQMPKTVKYLKTVLNAKEMLGYNKVEDNTFPNLMPVLNGLTGDEVENGCLKESKHRRFDNCPLVWKMFNEKSYITAYAEDSTYMGLFTFNRKGFHNLTTDYDYRIFDQVAVDETGHLRSANSDYCLGNDVRIVKLLNYTKEFAIKFKDNPYFGIFWGVSVHHDYLNDPSMVDENYYQMFKDLQDSGALENTALFVMSDHGIRWGGIRSTYQGFIEERLPFLFVSTPEWFRTEFSTAWTNLAKNTKRLTTPFDLHETFVDLRNVNGFLSSKSLRLRAELLRDKAQRGLSLFTPIPTERTCEMAAIPQHYCTCQSYKAIPVNETNVVKISEFVVDKMNELLDGYRECAKLELYKIHNARMGVPSTDEKLKYYSTEYTITLTTVPGNGTFEASVVVKNSTYYELTGTISRTNLYGEQSRCMANFHLKLYCYCLNLFSIFR